MLIFHEFINYKKHLEGSGCDLWAVMCDPDDEMCVFKLFTQRALPINPVPSTVSLSDWNQIPRAAGEISRARIACHSVSSTLLPSAFFSSLLLSSLLLSTSLPSHHVPPSPLLLSPPPLQFTRNTSVWLLFVQKQKLGPSAPSCQEAKVFFLFGGGSI